MTTDLARKVAELASHDVGEREITQNDSPSIRQYQAYVGLWPGDPYCAAAISTWIHEAALANGVIPAFRKSGSALSLLRLNAGLVFQRLTPNEVPCVAIYRHDSIHGHAALVVGYDTTTGKFQTIEANSNGAGSREGQGVYALNIRSVQDVQLAGFIRIE
jgi:hypothetical protein